MHAVVLGSLLCSVGMAQVDQPPTAPTGEELFLKHCENCHVRVPPDALTKAGWKSGLLQMSARLDLADDLLRKPPGGLTPEDRRVVRYHVEKMSRVESGLVLKEPIISLAQFYKISHFLVSNAPLEPLPQQGKAPVLSVGSPFSLGPTVPFDPLEHVAVTLVRIDEPTQRVFVGGVRDFDTALGRNPAYLSLLNDKAERLTEIPLDSAPVSLERVENDHLLTIIGSLATIQSSKAELIRLNVKKNRMRTTVLLDKQFRAAGSRVHVEADGSRLIAINGFGYYVGELSLVRMLKDEVVSRTTLLDLPGAMDSRFGDFDGDGQLDVLSLFAQHLEAVMLFVDDGFGGFEPVELLRHHASWGSSSMDLADFDGDGRLDLVLGNGDNADYPDAPLKNYHGVRIYRDSPSDEEPGPRFEEVYFQPIHGVYKVLARDFDLDGDPDLALIARTIDERAVPRENFVYMENTTPKGALTPTFGIMVMPQLQASDFMTMDAGDLDGDGDLDLVLGSAISLVGKRRSPARPYGVTYLINGSANSAD